MDFLIIKWRGLVHLCIVFELMFIIPLNVIVNESKSYSDFSIMQGQLFIFLALYSNRGWQIVLLTCVMMFLCYFILDSVLERELYGSVAGIARLILWGLAFFVGYVSLSGILIYITELQDLLRKFID